MTFRGAASISRPEFRTCLRVGELEFAVRPVAENADEYLLEALVYLLKAVEEARLDVLGEVGD